MYVASWKANMGTIENAQTFFKELPQYAVAFQNEIILCPSFIFMEMAKEKMPHTVTFGAQDCSQFSNGPHTAEITASMLANFGVKYCIVGHMERRAMGDTDVIVNKKIKQCLGSGITPIITIGENIHEYNNNMSRVIIEHQIKESLQGVKQYDKLVYCYQPAWSIGTGHFASAEYANLIIDFMRKTIQKVSGQPLAGNVPILYGGGVTQTNLKDYLEQPEVDGVMFGINTTNAKALNDMVSVRFTPKG